MYLVVDGDIANKYGLEESIMWRFIADCIGADQAHGEPKYNGRRWTKISVADISKRLEFWTPRVIERVLKSCINKGMLDCEKSVDGNMMDKTKWYASNL